MAEHDGEKGGKIPCVDHNPLNEGAIGKKINFLNISLNFITCTKFFG